MTTMEYLPVNLLNKILSFVTTDEILKISTLNHNISNLFTHNSVLWDIAFKVKPLGFVVRLSSTPRQIDRESCIRLLKIYDSCRSTSSMNLLLSTLSLYEDSQELCI